MLIEKHGKTPERREAAYNYDEISVANSRELKEILLSELSPAFRAQGDDAVDWGMTKKHI